MFEIGWVGFAIRMRQVPPVEMRKCKGFIVSYGNRAGRRSKGKSAILRSFPTLSPVRKSELVKFERTFQKGNPTVLMSMMPSADSWLSGKSETTP